MNKNKKKSSVFERKKNYFFKKFSKLLFTKFLKSFSIVFYSLSISNFFLNSFCFSAEGISTLGPMTIPFL